MTPIILLQGFRVGISQHTVDIEKEYRFPEMAIYVLIRNVTGTSITECKKSHADSSLETSGEKKSVRENKTIFWHSTIALQRHSLSLHAKEKSK